MYVLNCKWSPVLLVVCVASKHCIVGRILYCLVIYLARTVRNVSNVILQ